MSYHPLVNVFVVVAVGADGTIAVVPFVLLEILPEPTLLRFAATIKNLAMKKWMKELNMIWSRLSAVTFTITLSCTLV